MLAIISITAWLVAYGGTPWVAILIRREHGKGLRKPRRSATP